MTHAHDPEHLSRRWFGKSSGDLAAAERRVIESASARRPVSRDVNAGFSTGSTFGERLADRVASFGGSWAFISLFGLTLAVWTGMNLLLRKEAFDPYPFIFMALHEKLDEMRDRQMRDLILRQQEQIEILTQLVKRQVDEKPA